MNALGEIEKDNEQAKKVEYPDEFEFLWGEIPKREGGNSKKDAFKCCNARIKEGSSWRVLIQGVRNYRKYCEDKQMIGTQYVMQMATFLGTAKHYENEWKVNHEAIQQSSTKQHRLTAEDQRNQELLSRYGNASSCSRGSDFKPTTSGLVEREIQRGISSQVEQEGVTIDMGNGVIYDDGRPDTQGGY